MSRKEVELNHETYQVLQNEFLFIEHQEYNTLKITPDLGIYERYVGFIQNLTYLFSDETPIVFSSYYTTHGGYIPIELSKKYDYMKPLDKIYCIKTLENHKQNIIQNYERLTNHLHSKTEIVFDTSFPNNTNFLFSTFPISTQTLSSSFVNQSILFIPYTPIHQNRLKDTHHCFSFLKTQLCIYIPLSMYEAFLQRYSYCINLSTHEINYDNLIHYTMIIKNGGDTLEQVLTENLPYIDSWTILDTGSTDGTQDVIRRILGVKPGNLYEEPFINFRESRNRCLELAPNHCKFKIMLDDTYIMKGDLRQFLTVVRGDQFSNSFSLIIKSHDSEYYSNRVIKSKDNLKYISKIHEIIQDKNNVNVVIPPEVSFIQDLSTDYMEKRTKNRKQLDLQLLDEMIEEEPDNPRHLYYVAQTYKCLEDYEKVAEYYLKRIEHPVEGFLQEKLDACFELARTYNFFLNKPWELSQKYYQMAYDLDNTRPEPLYFLGIHYYLLKDENEKENRKKAYDYFVRAFALGYPVHAQYSLKPTLVYHFLPKFLCELCCEFQNYDLGEKSAIRFLQNNKSTDAFYETMSSWYGLFHYYNESMKMKNKR